jgi:hypothetical protein
MKVAITSTEKSVTIVSETLAKNTTSFTLGQTGVEFKTPTSVFREEFRNIQVNNVQLTKANAKDLLSEALFKSGGTSSSPTGTGYFETEALLLAKHPNPKTGDSAWVGTPYPGVVYDVLTDGTWHATTTAPETPAVDLDNWDQTNW